MLFLIACPRHAEALQLVNTRQPTPKQHPIKALYFSAAQSIQAKNCFFYFGHSRPLFLYFPLFNAVLSMLPIAGFEPSISGFGSDHSTNCSTTTAQFVYDIGSYLNTCQAIICLVASCRNVTCQIAAKNQKEKCPEN